MKPRLYPFAEPTPPGPQTFSASNNVTITNMTTTVYKPNPFKGADRFYFAVDEWGHRNLGRLHGPLLGWLCDRWERRLGDPS